MSTELVLFVLRIASAISLLGFLAALFVLLWRNFQEAIHQVESTRRSYGRLVLMQEIDGKLIMMGKTYPLMPLTSLGRAATNAIVIEDSFASSEHARVVLREGQWWLEDRQSRNGTTLNEMPVSQPIVMTSGDVIGIGQRRYRLELE